MLGDMRIGVPVLGQTRLLEQLDARGIERGGEVAGVGLGIGAVGVDPHAGAARDRALYQPEPIRRVVPCP